MSRTRKPRVNKNWSQIVTEDTNIGSSLLEVGSFFFIHSALVLNSMWPCDTLPCCPGLAGHSACDLPGRRARCRTLGTCYRQLRQVRLPIKVETILHYLLKQGGEERERESTQDCGLLCLLASTQIDAPANTAQGSPDPTHSSVNFLSYSGPTISQGRGNRMES